MSIHYYWLKYFKGMLINPLTSQQNAHNIFCFTCCLVGNAVFVILLENICILFPNIGENFLKFQKTCLQRQSKSWDASDFKKKNQAIAILKTEKNIFF